MSFQLPIRSACPRILSRRATALRLPKVQQRYASDDSKSQPENPLLEEYHRKQAAADAEPNQQTPPAPGDLAPSSIFEDERRERLSKQKDKDGRSSGFVNTADLEDRSARKTTKYERNPEAMAYVLDPNPAGREAWERRKIIKMIRKGGRMTRTEMIMRQEREHLAKSPNYKTSVKKLGMLARQIAGKTVEDAEVQMRFSKKKAAKDVLEHLQAAKNEAIVAKGMGLGHIAEDGTVIEDFPKQDIQLKDGKRHTVGDLSKMYISQAWVGRGPYGKLPDYRARGRIYVMRTPWTSLSVVLKEEKTRLREWQDREARRKKQRVDNLWTHLPDRPLQGPRGQYFCW